MKNMNDASYEHIIDFYGIQKFSYIIWKPKKKSVVRLVYYLCTQFFKGSRDCDLTDD